MSNYIEQWKKVGLSDNFVFQKVMEIQICAKRFWKDVFIIFICNFDPIGLEYSQYRFKTISPDNYQIVLDDGRTIILLNSHGNDENLNQGLRNFLELFNGHKVEGDDLIDRLDKAINDIKQRSDCRMEWISRQCDLQDQRRMGREEGRAEGKTEERDLLRKIKSGDSDEKLLKEGYTQEDIDDTRKLFKELIA